MKTLQHKEMGGFRISLPNLDSALSRPSKFARFSDFAGYHTGIMGQFRIVWRTIEEAVQLRNRKSS